MTIDYKAFEGATPGPWEHDNLDPARVNASGDGEMVACCGLNGHHDDFHEVIANARLIAAAPTLLSDHKRMSAEIERLRKALTFYADSKRYAAVNLRNDGTDKWSGDEPYYKDIHRDNGEVARAALASSSDQS